MPRLASTRTHSGESSRPRLEAPFGMSNEALLHGDRLLHYAMARAACKWLDERHALWPFSRAWRDQLRADPEGRLARRSVLHETPAEANDEWTRWVAERSRGFRPNWRGVAEG